MNKLQLVTKSMYTKLSYRASPRQKLIIRSKRMYIFVLILLNVILIFFISLLFILFSHFNIMHENSVPQKRYVELNYTVSFIELNFKHNYSESLFWGCIWRYFRVYFWLFSGVISATFRGLYVTRDKTRYLHINILTVVYIYIPQELKNIRILKNLRGKNVYMNDF